MFEVTLKIPTRYYKTILFSVNYFMVWYMHCKDTRVPVHSHSHYTCIVSCNVFFLIKNSMLTFKALKYFV